MLYDGGVVSLVPLPPVGWSYSTAHSHSKWPSEVGVHVCGGWSRYQLSGWRGEVSEVGGLGSGVEGLGRERDGGGE